jgi:hypothetical protein
MSAAIKKPRGTLRRAALDALPFSNFRAARSTARKCCIDCLLQGRHPSVTACSATNSHATHSSWAPPRRSDSCLHSSHVVVRAKPSPNRGHFQRSCNWPRSKALKTRLIMRARRATVLALSLAPGIVAQDIAFSQEYRGTMGQQMACTPDVWRLCSAQVPDVDRIVACLRRNTPQLSRGCRAVFEQSYNAPAPRRGQDQDYSPGYEPRPYYYPDYEPRPRRYGPRPYYEDE